MDRKKAQEEINRFTCSGDYIRMSEEMLNDIIKQRASGENMVEVTSNGGNKLVAWFRNVEGSDVVDFVYNSE